MVLSEARSGELLQWSGIETVTLQQKAGQHVALSVSDVHGFGTCFENGVDQPPPVRMVAEHESAFIAAAAASPSHRHPTGSEGGLR